MNLTGEYGNEGCPEKGIGHKQRCLLTPDKRETAQCVKKHSSEVMGKKTKVQLNDFKLVITQVKDKIVIHDGKCGVLLNTGTEITIPKKTTLGIHIGIMTLHPVDGE